METTILNLIEIDTRSCILLALAISKVENMAGWADAVSPLRRMCRASAAA